jgi:uncharacterized Zn finger protein
MAIKDIEMADKDIETLQAALQSRWRPSSAKNDVKVARYIGKFSDTTRMGTKISGRVQGNHGIYTVTIQLEHGTLSSTCSCYIGKHGFCHHCAALALTFLNDATIFREIKRRKRDEVRDFETLGEYLKSTTLDSLLEQLKSSGVTQKVFAEAIGMNPRHLSAIRSSEFRNRYYHDLGATKLACLWVLESFKDRQVDNQVVLNRGRSNAKTKSIRKSTKGNATSV